MSRDTFLAKCHAPISLEFSNSYSFRIPRRKFNVRQFRSRNLQMFIVREIMVEKFTARIKVSNFAEMFVLGYLLSKNIAPREIQTMTLAGAIKKGRKRGGIHRTFALFHPVDKIVQNLL